MANCVMITTSVMAENVDSLNRTAKCSEPLQNGAPVTLKLEEKAGSNVFTATKATKEGGIWLAYSPEVNKVVVGDVYGGEDPRNFVNVANKPFDVIRLMPGDIIQVTKEFFQNSQDPKTVSGATVVEIDGSGFKSLVSETSPGKPVFNIMREEPMIIGSAGIGGEQVQAWLLECVAN